MKPKTFVLVGATAILHFSTSSQSATGNLLAFGFHPQNIGSCLHVPVTVDSNICFNRNSNSIGRSSHAGGKRRRKRLDHFRIANDDDIISDDQNAQSFQLKQRNPFDVHVYYDGVDERQEAMELREKMQEKFQWMRFYTPKGRPIGPHPVPMWEADFGSYENRNLWSDVRDFIEEEHGNLSVLIHPHSLDGDYADHTKNSFWAGEVLDLRIQGWKH